MILTRELHIPYLAACALVDAALSGVYTTLCGVQAAVPDALQMAEMRGARLESAKADAAASARWEMICPSCTWCDLASEVD